MNSRSTRFTRALALFIPLAPLLALAALPWVRAVSPAPAERSGAAFFPRGERHANAPNAALALWWHGWGRLKESGPGVSGGPADVGRRATGRIEMLFLQAGGTLMDRPIARIESFDSPLLRYHVRARGLLPADAAGDFMDAILGETPYLFIESLDMSHPSRRHAEESESRRILAAFAHAFGKTRTFRRLTFREGRIEIAGAHPEPGQLLVRLARALSLRELSLLSHDMATGRYVISIALPLHRIAQP